MELDIVANMKHASTYSPVAFRSVHTGIKPPFLLKKYIMRLLLAWLKGYIQKILTKREMINCQKFNLLLFLTINSVTTGVRELNGTCQISLVTHDAKGRNARDLDEVSSGLARMWKWTATWAKPTHTHTHTGTHSTKVVTNSNVRLRKSKTGSVNRDKQLGKEIPRRFQENSIMSCHGNHKLKHSQNKFFPWGQFILACLGSQWTIWPHGNLS